MNVRHVLVLACSNLSGLCKEELGIAICNVFDEVSVAWRPSHHQLSSVDRAGNHLEAP